MDKVKDVLGDGPIATKITGGLGELVERFKTAGHGETADSWISTGPNRPITETSLESALGGDLIDSLVRQTASPVRNCWTAGQGPARGGGPHDA